MSCLFKLRKRKAYFYLALRNGAVVFNATRGSKTMELSSRGHLNDGTWKLVSALNSGAAGSDGSRCGVTDGRGAEGNMSVNCSGSIANVTLTVGMQ